MPKFSDISHPCGFKIKRIAVIGSAADCDIRLPAEPGIAERHLRIEYDHVTGIFVLKALSARHPLLVDEQNTRERRIVPGCVLGIGCGRFRFESDGLCRIAPGGAVRVRNLALKYRQRGPDILRRVSLDIRAGELFGIMGPSGCGKSTLMDCLRGELKPTAGRIWITPGATIGFVPQDNLLFDRLTVEENLLTSAVVRLPDRDPSAVRRQVDRVLAIIGLDTAEDRNKRCSELSGGMRKRVNAALELLNMPQILMLDEPTSGLDPATQADFMGFLKDLSVRCVTVVCVTHALETLDRFSHVVLLRKLAGDDATSMIFSGTPDKLRARYTSEEIVRLFDPAPDVPTPSVEDMAENRDEDEPVADRAGSGAYVPARPFWPAAKMTLLRAWLNLRRNRLNATMVFALPVILGGLVFLSQAPASDGKDWLDSTNVVLLTLIIASLWMGMNLAVREIVPERLLYLRELRVGLGKLEYLTGKVLYAALITAAQTLLVALAVFSLSRLQPWGLGKTTVPPPFAHVRFWLGGGAFATLWACAFSGALIGLTVSSLAKSQTLAVTLIPLFLIPHLLFNPNMDATQSSVYGDGPYCPAKHIKWPADTRGRVHLVGSGLLISRPAMHLMMSANPLGESETATRDNEEEYSQWRGLEWCYLCSLLAVHALVLLLAFSTVADCRRNSGRWRRA